MVSENLKSPKIFYGWFVVAACFMVTLTLGETFWAFGVFFKPLEDEFGWSRAMLSSSYSAFLIGYAISVVFAGRLADRYSPRPILFVTAVLLGVGIALAGLAQTINQLRFALFIAGLGSGATWSVPAASIQRWFYGRKWTGLALSIVLAGAGVGAIIFAPLVNYLITNFNWRSTYVIFGVLMFLIIAVSTFVIKRSPLETQPVSKTDGTTAKPIVAQSWPTAKAIVTAPYIGIVFIASVGAFTFNTMSVHVAPFATDIGISRAAAAAALGFLGGLSVPGRIMSGLISDLIGWQKMLIIAVFGSAISIMLLLFLKAEWMLYGFVLLYGICQGIRSAAQIGMMSSLFGVRSLGELIGISSATSQFISAFAPFIAGFLFDIAGSYTVTFAILTVLLLVGGVVATTIKKPRVATK